jgi:Fic family protein
MTSNFRSTAATQEKLIAYLKEHRVWNAEALFWQWLTAYPMPSHATLQAIDQLKTWLDAFRPLPPSVVSELRQRYQVRFTYHSNALEGNTLTQSETELVLTTGITIGGKTLQEHLEVIGHVEAIAYIELLAQQTTRLSEWEIRQIHSLILRKINPEEAGRYRTLDVQAAGTGYIYPPHYALSEQMTDFVIWLNSTDAQALHPILYAIEAHSRFVTIHPFRDGNGRTGRLLMNLLLLRAGYPIAVITRENRQRYIETLMQGQQSDDWEPLYALIIDAIQTSLVEVLGVLTTATEVQNKELPLYQVMLEFLQRQEQP